MLIWILLLRNLARERKKRIITRAYYYSGNVIVTID